MTTVEGVEMVARICRDPSFSEAVIDDQGKDG